MQAWQILVLTGLYTGIMFIIALSGDRRSGRPGWIPPALIYGLALPVYCTSWTYYGAVGQAASSGWHYLPVYLGPALMLTLGFPVLRRILAVAGQQNSSTVADFMAARYGKHPGIAALVTLVCLTAVIPYIALQLKAVSASIELLSGPGATGWQSIPSADTSLLISISMILFAILFGTRQLTVTTHHRGLMMAIAFESVVKLLALISLTVFILYSYYGGPERLLQLFDYNSPIRQHFTPDFDSNFWTQTLLAAGAVILLPRQFQVMIVENTHPGHLAPARWIFLAYLVLVALAVIPATSAGLTMFNHLPASGDSFVLTIPLANKAHWLAALVFIGGFSAAMAMIVMSTVALSTMVSNDVILPLLLRFTHGRTPERGDFSPALLNIRRLSITIIILLAYGYHHFFAETTGLAGIGLMAFSLLAQLIPAFAGALYWKDGNARGAAAGILSGVLVWTITLMLPILVQHRIIPADMMINGLFGQSWLRPQHLFWIDIRDPLTHGIFWSLLFNSLCYILFSRLSSTRLIDRLQATAFTAPPVTANPQQETGSRARNATVADLRELLTRFTGPRRAQKIFRDFETAHQIILNASDQPRVNLVRHVERTLSGIIGTSSARAMTRSVMSGKSLGIEEVVTFFDETTQAIQFNQKLLSSTLENIDQGVSVIDSDLRLVAWNRRYLELFHYPEGMVHIGCPIEDLVRYNAEKGDCGPGSTEDHIRRRVEHLRRGSPHRFIRLRTDGTVIEMKGNPFPGGGFVTTFSDISEHVNTQEQLRQSKDELEQRVEARTRTIQDINMELRAEIDHREEVEKELIKARKQAEAANASKTRFLALASHDILQPLNAARLYTASLLEDRNLDDGQHTLVGKLNESLQSTEELISTLLEIARLDDGVLTPRKEYFFLKDILTPLVDEFSIIARHKNLALKSVPCSAYVFSDPVYLRRILQNFLSNALKYTPSGKALIGCRHRGGNIEIQVWDTGPGIPEEDQKHIFEDFFRVEATSREKGVGLGLGVVSRMSQMLEHPLKMNSRPGSHTMFSISLEQHEAPEPQQQDTRAVTDNLPFSGVRVLCVDNMPENLLALEALLSRWGCIVSIATNEDEAIVCEQPDILVLDYQLDAGDTGIALVSRLRKHWQQQIPAVLVTANAEQNIRQAAQDADMSYLRKPIKPAPLRSLLTHMSRKK